MPKLPTVSPQNTVNATIPMDKKYWDAFDTYAKLWRVNRNQLILALAIWQLENMTQETAVNVITRIHSLQAEVSLAQVGESFNGSQATTQKSKANEVKATDK